jgi:hypothetical protein
MEIIHDYKIEGARIAAAIELDDGNFDLFNCFVVRIYHFECNLMR